MLLPDAVRDLADRILGRLDEVVDFYLHTAQAWRVVRQIAVEGRAVGIVETATGQEVPAEDLEVLSQHYVSVDLAESAFKSLSSLLEDWIVGLIRLWLTAYPVQLDAASIDVAERPRAQRREEIQVPLSEILAAPDRDAILGGVADRIVRELAFRRTAHWFRFLDNRVNLGCPDEAKRGALCEMKAARDVLEHNRGRVGPDYIDKAGDFARYALGEAVEIDEAYLLRCFALLRETVESMADAAIRRSSGPTAP
jgi:hypothetical protein